MIAEIFFRKVRYVAGHENNFVDVRNFHILEEMGKELEVEKYSKYLSSPLFVMEC